MLNKTLHLSLAALLIGALACGKTGSDITAPDDGGPTPGGSGMPSEIVGSWYVGSVSPTNYHNTSTGSWSNAGGEGMFYTLKANGKFEFGYEIYSTVYGCTITAMFWKTGTVTMDAASHVITLHPSEATLHSTDTCSASGNYDKAISRDPEVLSWNFVVDDYGERVLRLRWQGTDEFKDFYRWNQ